MSSKISSPGQCQCAGAVVKDCSLAFQPLSVPSSPACPTSPALSKRTLPVDAAMGSSDRPTSAAGGSTLAPAAAPTPSAQTAWRSSPPRGGGDDHSSHTAVSSQTVSAAGHHHQGGTPKSPDACLASFCLPDASPSHPAIRHAELGEAGRQSHANSSMCGKCACIAMQTLPGQSQIMLPFTL